MVVNESRLAFRAAASRSGAMSITAIGRSGVFANTSHFAEVKSSAQPDFRLSPRIKIRRFDSAVSSKADAFCMAGGQLADPLGSTSNSRAALAKARSEVKAPTTGMTRRLT